MTATSHALIGTAIAAAVPNPLIAIPLAIASHFLADLVPHWDTGTNEKKKTKQRLLIESFFDVLLSLVLSLLVFITFFSEVNLLYGLFIVFMAQLPDWLMSPYYFFKWKIPPFTWAFQSQVLTNVRLDKPWGIVTQVIVVLISLYIATTIYLSRIITPIFP